MAREKGRSADLEPPPAGGAGAKSAQGAARSRMEEELVRAHETLRASERRYRELVDFAPAGILQADPEGRPLLVNQALAKMLGYASTEELLGDRGGMTRGFYVYPEGRDALMAKVDRPGGLVDFEVPLWRRDGTVLWTVCAAHAIRDAEGRLVCREAFFVDITERKEFEEKLRQAQKAMALGEIVGGVAHQVRNPLLAISAAVDALEERIAGDTDLEEYAAALRREVSRLTSFMSALLAFGKETAADRRPVPLRTLVGAASEECADALSARGVSVANEVSADLPAVIADRHRIVDVLVHLLENAIHFSPEGGTVAVSASLEREGGASRIRCRVSDSGPGFEPEDVLHAFSPFFTRRRGRPGLGLALVRQVIEEHGGSVAASDRPGGGAVVEFTLPCEES